MIPTIEVEGLSLSYGRVQALTHVSFTLEGPRICGLLGRNGSGKTTLLAVLAGLREGDSGRIRIGGWPAFEDPRTARRICLIRGGGDTVEADWPSDRVRDALTFAAHFRPRWDGEYAHRLLERFEVPLDRRIEKLSSGKRSALAVTLGLASRAPVTMLDEAHLAMDAPSRYAFYDELLADYVDHPRTIIISTHLIGEIARLLEEVLILDGGRILLHEETEALRGRGVTVTGPAEAVDRVANGLPVLHTRRLGSTKQVALYGDLAGDRQEAASRAGLEIGSIPLQDLFVHLTEPREPPHAHT